MAKTPTGRGWRLLQSPSGRLPEPPPSAGPWENLQPSHQTVTYVPGLTCNLCPRLFRAGVMRANAEAKVNLTK
jgi:hypothetical protein